MFKGNAKSVRLSEVRVIGGLSYRGVFLYENSAQCSRGMQNQFDLVKFELSGV